MLAYERRQAIVEILKSDHSVQAAGLARQFFVSESTIRRDLAIIARDGSIRRTYGGAVLLDGKTGDAPMLMREKLLPDEKRSMARAALPFLRDGMVIFMDTSSTVLAIAPLLAQFTSLTVVTNGLMAAYQLNGLSNVTTHVTGGRLREHNAALVGGVTCQRISEINGDLALISCRGISAVRGVTEASEEEAQAKRAMINSSEQVIALCDSSKVGKSTMNRICGIERLCALITDAPPPEDEMRAYEQAGLRVIISL